MGNYCLSENKDFNEYVRREALKFRREKRREWIDGKIPQEDRWLIEKQEEMFPHD